MATILETLTECFAQMEQLVNAETIPGLSPAERLRASAMLAFIAGTLIEKLPSAQKRYFGNIFVIDRNTAAHADAAEAFIGELTNVDLTGTKEYFNESIKVFHDCKLAASLRSSTMPDAKSTAQLPKKAIPVERRLKAMLTYISMLETNLQNTESTIYKNLVIQFDYLQLLELLLQEPSVLTLSDKQRQLIKKQRNTLAHIEKNPAVPLYQGLTKLIQCIHKKLVVSSLSLFIEEVKPTLLKEQQAKHKMILGIMNTYSVLAEHAEEPDGTENCLKDLPKLQQEYDAMKRILNQSNILRLSLLSLKEEKPVYHEKFISPLITINPNTEIRKEDILPIKKEMEILQTQLKSLRKIVMEHLHTSVKDIIMYAINLHDKALISELLGNITRDPFLKKYMPEDLIQQIFLDGIVFTISEDILLTIRDLGFDLTLGNVYQNMDFSKNPNIPPPYRTAILDSTLLLLKYPSVSQLKEKLSANIILIATQLPAEYALQFIDMYPTLISQSLPLTKDVHAAGINTLFQFLAQWNRWDVIDSLIDKEYFNVNLTMALPAKSSLLIYCCKPSSVLHLKNQKTNSPNGKKRDLLPCSLPIFIKFLARADLDLKESNAHAAIRFMVNLLSSSTENLKDKDKSLLIEKLTLLINHPGIDLTTVEHVVDDAPHNIITKFSGELHVDLLAMFLKAAKLRHYTVLEKLLNSHFSTPESRLLFMLKKNIFHPRNNFSTKQGIRLKQAQSLETFKSAAKHLFASGKKVSVAFIKTDDNTLYSLPNYIEKYIEAHRTLNFDNGFFSLPTETMRPDAQEKHAQCRALLNDAMEHMLTAKIAHYEQALDTLRQHKLNMPAFAERWDEKIANAEKELATAQEKLEQLNAPKDAAASLAQKSAGKT